MRLDGLFFFLIVNVSTFHLASWLKVSADILKYFFSYFSYKIGFDISYKLFPYCLLRRQFAWNVKAYFLGKIKTDIINLSTAEIAQRVTKVKYNVFTHLSCIRWSTCIELSTSQ